MVAGELADVLFTGRRGRAQDDEGVRRLAPLRVGKPDDRRFLDGGMAQQHAFHFD